MSETTSNKEVIQQFKETVEDLHNKGYILARKPLSQVMSNPKLSMAEGAIGVNGNIKFKNEMLLSNLEVIRSKPTPKDSNGNDIGTPGLGFMPWGHYSDDRLPLHIYHLSRNLPYTASGLRYLVDLTVGKGPKFMYRIVRENNGKVEEDYIPFEDAGIVLRKRLSELRAEQEDKEKENIMPGIANVGIINESKEGPQSYRVKSAEPAKTPTDISTVGTLESELQMAEQEYLDWERTLEMHKEFTERNDIADHYLKCTTDDWHCDICFPTIGLNNGLPNDWSDAKILSIGVIPAVCARFEERNENGDIKYVYQSERFRYLRNTLIKQGEMVAYPMMASGTLKYDLKKYVDSAKNTAVAKRQKWFCCPSEYPSCFTPYYPYPAWWSIFSSYVYMYASTLIYDKAISRNNATMWGKIIFIDQAYEQSLYDNAGATTDEEKDKIYNDLIADINNFLRRRENSGKTMTASKYIGMDGKTEHKGIEIVDVPQLSSAATKDELEEISSIIFFALGLDPRLVGAVPGKSQSSSGTQSRELHLLKEIQCSPRQRKYLRFLNNVYAFNGATDKGVWQIAREVLSTLDASKTGIVEQKNS